MNGAGAPGARNPSRSGGGSHAGHGHDGRDLWPRDFGRDGVSGLVTLDRALRAREVSRPDPEDERMASDVLAELLARVDGRRQPAARSRS
ncbi:hypothetical protein [uncultured Friedmanniella sp.]|uniref:hypothetical protein n=1 Tax=uncultured Friedmanniella sp. TaxID=335381 RepID=UPI0035CA6562